MRKVLAILSAAGLAGCVTATPGGQAVVLTSNVGLVSGCRFISQKTVSVSSMESLAGALTFTQDAENKLRNAAMKIGGTHVVTSGPQTSTNLATQTGDVYKC